MEKRRKKYIFKMGLGMVVVALPMSIALCFLFIPESAVGAERRFNALWNFRTLFFFYGLIFSAVMGMNTSTVTFSRLVSYGAARKQAISMARRIQLLSIGAITLFTMVFDMITRLCGPDIVTDLLIIAACSFLALSLSFGLSILAVRYQKTGYYIALPILIVISASIMVAGMFFRYEVFDIAGKNIGVVIFVGLFFAVLSLILNRKKESMLGKMDIASWIV